MPHGHMKDICYALTESQTVTFHSFQANSFNKLADVSMVFYLILLIYDDEP